MLRPPAERNPRGHASSGTPKRTSHRLQLAPSTPPWWKAPDSEVAYDWKQKDMRHSPIRFHTYLTDMIILGRVGPSIRATFCTFSLRISRLPEALVQPLSRLIDTLGLAPAFGATSMSSLPTLP